MSLSPKDVRNRKFHQSITGYDAKEVSLFLRDVALELEKISMQNIHLSEANRGQFVMQRAVRAHDGHDVVQRTGIERRLVRVLAGGKLMQHAAHVFDDTLQRVELRRGQRVSGAGR